MVNVLISGTEREASGRASHASWSVSDKKLCL